MDEKQYIKLFNYGYFHSKNELKIMNYWRWHEQEGP